MAGYSPLSVVFTDEALATATKIIKETKKENLSLYKDKLYGHNESGFFEKNGDVITPLIADCSMEREQGVILYENGDTADILSSQGIICIPKKLYIKKVPIDFQIGDYVEVMPYSEAKKYDSNLFLWNEQSAFNAFYDWIKNNLLRIKTKTNYYVEFEGSGSAYPIFGITRVIPRTEIAEKLQKVNEKKIKEIFENMYTEKIKINEKVLNENLRSYFNGVRKNEFLIAESAEKLKSFYSEFQEKINFADDKIRKHKDVLNVIYDIENLTFRIFTKPLFIEYGRDDRYIGVFAGKFEIVMNIKTQNVSIENATGFSWKTHPHIGSSGNPCWGNLNKGMIEAMKSCDYYDVFIHAIELLHGISGSTYYSIIDRNMNKKTALKKFFEAEDIKYNFKIEGELYEGNDEAGCNNCEDCEGTTDDCGCECHNWCLFFNLFIL